MYALPIVASNRIASTVETVRNDLLSLTASALEKDRWHLASMLSEALGALEVLPTAPAARPRTLDDGGPDFEDSASWPAWTDEDVWTPTDVLALSLPPISGGAPYEPSAEDWLDYEFTFLDRLEDIAKAVELDPGRFTEADARAAGLAV